MSDELEPFRKAAELGCKDFEVLKCSNHDDGLCIIRFHYPAGRFNRPDLVDIFSGDAGFKQVQNNPRINRYAANVCAEWWSATQWEELTDAARKAYCSKGYFFKEAHDRIEQCRAFAKKYGRSE